jgi:FAD:protein FMN transferase
VAVQFIAQRSRLAPWLLVTLLISACQPAPSSRVVSMTGSTMGTTYHIKYVVEAARGSLEPQQTQPEIERILGGIDRSMSTWREDSDISRFNASNATDWFPVSADLVEVISAAERVSALSGGAFDVTVKPLIDLWGFGQYRGNNGAPTAEAIATARAAVGYQRLHWRRQPPALRKEFPALRIEVAAIAPGYAVDRISDRLAALGAASSVVEVGGEVRVRGRGPDGRLWRVGIERPDTGGGLDVALELTDTSLSTSGSYRNILMLDGKNYSHEIDPRLGRPVTHRTVSVAVLAPNTMEADAWSTALMVLGSEAGLALADRLRISARFIDIVEGASAVRATASFSTVTSKQ